MAGDVRRHAGSTAPRPAVERFSATSFAVTDYSALRGGGEPPTTWFEARPSMVVNTFLCQILAGNELRY
jgi:hypothetical protein